MFAEIAVTLEIVGSVPTFRLSTDTGGVPRITALAITDASNDEAIWRLLPGSFTSVHPFTIVEVDEESVQSLAATDDIDPIEDLPASDARHQRALAERVALEDAVLIPLGVVVYGEVPQGFRQCHPMAGPAPPLAPGREYHLVVMGGSDAGHLSFTL
jgi:hypothetical protein